MAAKRDPNVLEFGQMAIFSLALAATMFVFGFKEDGTSTKILCFLMGGLFIVVTGFFAFITLSLTRPAKTPEATGTTTTPAVPAHR